MAPPAESSSLSPKAQAALQACRARTGFQSYHAYLDFHKLDPWALNGLCEPLRPLTESKAESLDTNRELKQSGSLVLNVSKDWQLSVDRLHRDEKGTNIIEAICHRPEDAQLQIILWGNEREKGSSRSRESLVDFLGLRFGLDPLIFWAMDAMCYGDEFQRQEELDRYEPTYVRVGKVIATVCYSRDDSNEKPVLLIAGCPVQLGEELDPCPPFDHSVSLDEQLYSTRTFGRHGFYLRALNQSLERYKTAQAKSIDLLLLGLFPFLQLLLVRIRQECKHMWELLGRSKEAARDNPTRKAAFENTLYIRRSMLRSTIEDAEDGWSSVMRYMRLRCRWNPRRRAIGQALEEDVKSIVAEAKRLESTVRDHLQLQAGVLSLEESKKSIEVSNQQIEEAKRGKSPPNQISFYRPDTMLQSKSVRACYNSGPCDCSKYLQLPSSPLCMCHSTLLLQSTE